MCIHTVTLQQKLTEHCKTTVIEKKNLTKKKEASQNWSYPRAMLQLMRQFRNLKIILDFFFCYTCGIWKFPGHGSMQITAATYATAVATSDS